MRVLIWTSVFSLDRLGNVGAPRRDSETTCLCCSDLYRRRTSVEREFGRLKHDYGLAPLRVRSLAKVALHADLTMLARLSQALLRARTAVPLAA